MNDAAAAPPVAAPRAQHHRTVVDRLALPAWHLGLQGVLWCGGGTAVLLLAEPWVSGPQGQPIPTGLWLSAAISLVAVTAAGWRLFRRATRRRWVFGTMLHLLLILVTGVTCELVARACVPEWPARELHGVSPAEWTHATAQVLPPGEINSWGQRDRERDVTPDEGTYRIAFVGDSFLEEGPGTPISLLVEEKLTSRHVEVVNLGVSATAPDEYFDRVCRVAEPLGSRHCVVFVFAGNDFAAAPRTLVTHAGIAAVAPRQSLLRLAGCGGINHVLTNRERPVVQAWMSAGGLAAHERQLHEFLQMTDDALASHALLNADQLPPPDRARLAEQIMRPEFAPFLAMLREPDDGRFRSYYLSAALWSASVGGGQWEADSPDSALYWMAETADHCRRRDMGLTIVIIPEAFQVDERMIEQWAPLTDMRHLTQPTRAAAEQFYREAVAAGWDVLDLHETFDGARGAYLNVDGHWSPAGAALAAQAVSGHLAERGLH